MTTDIVARAISARAYRKAQPRNLRINADAGLVSLRARGHSKNFLHHPNCVISTGARSAEWRTPAFLLALTRLIALSFSPESMCVNEPGLWHESEGHGFSRAVTAPNVSGL